MDSKGRRRTLMIALLLTVGGLAASAAWHLLDSLAPSARAENEAQAVHPGQRGYLVSL